jgi:maltose O-acetyltransferase
MIKNYIKYLFKRFNLYHIVTLSKKQLFVNFIFQRIFLINSECNTSIHFTSRVTGYKNIIIKGSNKLSVISSMAMSGGCYFNVFDGTTLEIGEGTIWSYNVCIQTGNHDFIDRSNYVLKNVKIGNNCWIGHAVTIVAGVELGDNVVVGANSVVTKSFPSNVVIGGVPAKVIKEI